MVQEYGRYFDMPTCCLRGGCLTGPNHTGVELHGFLSYLVQVQSRGTRIQGISDTKASRCATTFIRSMSPASCTHLSTRHARAEVYNLGGGKANSCSILEAFELVEKLHRRKPDLHLRRRSRESATTSATTATCGKCARTTRRGISRSRSTKRSVRSSTRGNSAPPSRRSRHDAAHMPPVSLPPRNPERRSISLEAGGASTGNRC